VVCLQRKRVDALRNFVSFHIFIRLFAVCVAVSLSVILNDYD